MIYSISTQTFIALVLKYKYFILYPLVVTEGSVATMAAGFLASLKIVNVFIAFAIIIVGDMTSDLLFYGAGQLGAVWQRAAKFLSRFGFESRKEKFIRLFDRQGWKLFIVGKITHSLAGLILVGAGYARIRFCRILWYSFVGAFVKAVILFFIGYLAGAAYEQYAKYLESVIVILSLGSIFLLIILFHLPKPIISKVIGLEDDNSIEDLKND